MIEVHQRNNTEGFINCAEYKRKLILIGESKYNLWNMQ